jgi:hypothetical protein
MGHKTFEKNNSFQKDFWKQGQTLTFQMFITTIWLRFHVIEFHIYLYDFIFQPMFSHNKQFGVEINMNSWFF